MPQINLADANFVAIFASRDSIVACNLIVPRRWRRIRRAGHPFKQDAFSPSVAALKRYCRKPATSLLIFRRDLDAVSP
jgi:hypothetical protein